MDLREQRKFVHEWLWESKTRKTIGMPWSADYVEDAAQMLADYALRQTDSARKLKAAEKEEANGSYA
jgi:hypothetical protein